ncbi:hypothetical protein MTO96_025502 [Rhipicephalus appendiculatus]
MGNLITTVGQDSGEGGTNQLLASTRNEPEAHGGSSLSDHRWGDFSARDCVHPAVRRGRTESRQVPSPMSLSLGSRASLVPHHTARERLAEGQGVQARGHILKYCDSRRPIHIHSSRHQPRGAAGAPRPGADLRRTTRSVAERSPSSSPSSPSSLSPVTVLSAPASPSDERCMLARPHIQASAPEVQLPPVERVNSPPGCLWTLSSTLPSRHRAVVG